MDDFALYSSFKEGLNQEINLPRLVVKEWQDGPNSKVIPKRDDVMCARQNLK